LAVNCQLIFVRLLTTDGIVPSYSAANLPGGMEFLNDNNQSIRILEGSNHQQMNNDSQLEEKLSLLFDGELDPYFQMAKR